MSDARRFHHMAALVADVLPDRTLRIADVAAGKGHLRAALYERGYRRVTCWDRRRRCATPRSGYRYGLFDHRSAPRDYEAVVALHPDAGTDHAVLYAVERQVPALVCPCCVQPSAVVYHGRHDYESWCAHLEGLVTARGIACRWLTLPIAGRAMVLVIAA